MKLWQEFKSFAFKGNMIDLAVGVVIGTAFTKVVTSVVTNLMMPLIGYVTPKTDFSDWKLGKITIGLLINDLITFLIVAIAVFIFVVKLIGAMTQKAAEAPAPSEPTSKECPRCLSVIPLKATRCPQCTSDLDGPGLTVA